MQERVPKAIAFMYPDGSVEVVRMEDRDDAPRGSISQLEFTIPFTDEIVNGESVQSEMPWPDVVVLGMRKIRGKIAILPDGSFGDRGTCRGCGVDVVFVKLPSGKRPPFNYDGESHFSTCPDAERWRTTRPRYGGAAR